MDVVEVNPLDKSPKPPASSRRTALPMMGRGREAQSNDPKLPSEVISLVVQVVTSHVARNVIASFDLPTLIAEVRRALTSLEAAEERPAQALKPAVPINESVTNNYIICLEDGRKMKLLRPHLRVSYNLTADQYRKRWGLPDDYPMVAPSYSQRRSLLAKKRGFGVKATKRQKGL